MKLLTEKEIEAKAVISSLDFHEYENHYYIIAYQKGAQETQKLLLESASEGYSTAEMRKAYDFKGGNFHGIFNNDLHTHLIETGRRLWQACSLHHAKKMQEKDAEIERLKESLAQRSALGVFE